MITVNGQAVGFSYRHDGTTNPVAIEAKGIVNVDWRFESLSEIFELFRLRAHLMQTPMTLKMPYLPFQVCDSEVKNDKIADLPILADMLNVLGFESVTSVDVYNPVLTARLIRNFKNETIENTHKLVIETYKPDALVFLNHRCLLKYEYSLPKIVLCERMDGVMDFDRERCTINQVPPKVLILQDISEANCHIGYNILRESNPNVEITHFCTHKVTPNIGMYPELFTDSLGRNSHSIYKV